MRFDALENWLITRYRLTSGPGAREAALAIAATLPAGRASLLRGLVGALSPIDECRERIDDARRVREMSGKRSDPTPPAIAAIAAAAAEITAGKLDADGIIRDTRPYNDPGRSRRVLETRPPGIRVCPDPRRHERK